MARFALALALLLLGLLAFLFRPPAVSQEGGGEGRFEEVEFWLFPKADPDARWRFSAQAVDYDADRRQIEVSGMAEGARYVEENTDLLLYAERVTIDRFDNLRMPQAVVELPNECWRLELEGSEERPVRIDQNQGFYAPSFVLRGPGLRVEGKGFRSDFALENVTWRSGKEEWRTGEEDACQN